MAENDDFAPRDYQVELMKIAMEKNTIIYLPTGAGKTYIAVLVIKRLAAPLTIPWDENGKVTILLVNTIALVHQHAKYIGRHTTFTVGEYTGDLNVDFWDENTWRRECKQKRILIMTCQILTNAVEKHVLDLNRVNLLIFDECHRGVNDQPMRQLMKNFQYVTHKPRVLGLTATLLNGNCKPARVMELVEDLEVTYHSKVATVDELKNVIGFSTNPRERLIFYTAHNTTSAESKAISYLNHIIDILRRIHLDDKDIPTVENVTWLEEDKGLTGLANLLADTIIHIRMLGTFGGIEAIVAHSIQIECMKKFCNDAKLYHVLNSMITALTYAKTLLKNQLSGNLVEDIYNFSSAKVKELFNILANYENSTIDLCAIIFVQRRFTAKVVFQILKILSMNVKDFSFLKPNFVVGFNANPFKDTRESLYHGKITKEIITSFNSKEINLLVSSNVLEEGIDVPTCTLVVKFDEPLDYRSYIQSKGRARHRDSLYCIMVEQQDLCRYNVKYSTFQTIEQKLNEYLIGKNEARDGPQQKSITRELYNEDKIPPYYVNGPGSAQVNMVSAITLLSAYCNSFETDAYTTYAPNWYLETQQSKSPIAFMRVVIELPTICPYIDPILGHVMATKKDAKRAAALRACEILHKIGELDDKLRPIRRTGIDDETDFFFQHWSKVKEKYVGHKKMTRLHKIHISECFTGQLLPMNLIYLHIISLEPKFDTSSDVNLDALMDLYSKNLCLGLISVKEFPKLCKFPLYDSSGEIEVDILTNATTLFLTEIELDKIRRFNHLLYNDILDMLKRFLIINNEDTILVVPVDKENKIIDFEVMDQNKSLKDRSREPTREERLTLDINELDFLGKIVTPWYRKDDTEYLVTNICYDMDAYTTFPGGNFQDYLMYYKTLYQCTILKPNQPLIRVKAISQKTNYLKPRGSKKSKKNKEPYVDYIIHLVPELVVIQNFPACLWLQAKLLPSVFDKLYQLLRAEDLRKSIATYTGIGNVIQSIWKPLRLDKHLIRYEFESSREEDEVMPDENVEILKMENILSLTHMLNKEVVSNTLQEEYPWDKSEEPVDIDRITDVTLMDIQYYVNFVNNPVKPVERQIKTSPEKHKPALTYNKYFVERQIRMLDICINSKGPELSDIYKALATAKCNDIVNLERLETLGDSFLKFIASLVIILKYPKYDEGKSTSLKGKLVSNQNLYYLAKRRNLSGCLKFFDLNAKEDWCPPGFCLPEVLRNRSIVTSALLSMTIPPDEQISGVLSGETIDALNAEISKNTSSEDNYNKSINYYLGDHHIPDKFIADTAESLLGVYLQSCGTEGAIKILEWLDVVPAHVNLISLLNKPLPNPVLNPDGRKENIDFHIPQYKELEKSLGYKFRNRAYLLQALTHSSYTPNRITKCYQRLEFLGDAVLDFLITMFIYENCEDLTPGNLTDLRSAIVNNITFACFSVRCGFHKHLLAINHKLQSYIDKFIKYQENRNFAVNDDVLILLNEDDFHLAEYVDVPKVLGDLFESLAGAVYLDSGMNLKVVWNVFYRIMWKEIDDFRNNVPKNAIRVLHETTGAHPEFHKPMEIEHGKSMVKLDFMINGTKKRVHGFGDNKSVAKRAAAKIALRLLGK